MNYKKFDNDTLNQMIYARRGARIDVDRQTRVVTLYNPTGCKRQRIVQSGEAVETVVQAMWKECAPDYVGGRMASELLSSELSFPRWLWLAFRQWRGIGQEAEARLIAQLWLKQHENGSISHAG